jgi:hypothetical protein
LWSSLVEECTNLEPGGRSLHLAVFVEPYLGLLMAGKKTIESRFSQNGCAPFEQVFQGDLVLLKHAGSAIVGIGHVREARHIRRAEGSWEQLRETFQEQLCATEKEFWENTSIATHATLIWFDRLRPLPSLDCEKRDRRGWVVLRRASDQLCLEFV